MTTQTAQTMTAGELFNALDRGGRFRIETPQYSGAAYSARMVIDEEHASRVRQSLGLRNTPAVGDIVFSDGVRASVWKAEQTFTVTPL